MAEFVVTGSPLAGIAIVPRSVVEEVTQNVRCYLCTRKGSVPLDRLLGFDWDAVDATMLAGMQKILADIVIGLPAHEPRVEVLHVSWEEQDAALDGAIYPKVIFKLKEGVE